MSRTTKKNNIVGKTYSIGACPNCGGSDGDMELDYYSIDGVYAPYCSHCGKFGRPGETVEEAIQLWDEEAPYIRCTVKVGQVDEYFPYEILDEYEGAETKHKGQRGAPVRCFITEWTELPENIKHVEESCEYEGDEKLSDEDLYELYSDWIFDMALYKDFEPVLENVALHDKRYQKQMNEIITNYDKIGYVTHPYDEILWTLMWELMKDQVEHIPHMKPGEVSTNSVLPFKITRTL